SAAGMFQPAMAMATLTKKTRARISDILSVLRRRRIRLFLKIFFLDDVVARFDPFPRLFHFGSIEDERRAVSDHLDDEVVGLFLKRFGQIIQSPHFLAVHFIDNRAAIWCEIGIDLIWEDIAEDDHVWMLQVNLIEHVIIKEMPDTQIAQLKLMALKQVQVQRLKKQAAVKDVARPHIIAVALHKIRPD